MRRNVLAMILALSMLLGLCACGKSGTENKTTETSEATTEAVETETKTEAATEADEVYRVKVVDTDGTPIIGALVQMCLDTCFPSATGEGGVAEFKLEEADYKVTFMRIPDGYTYSTDEQEFYFDSGSKEMTIVLKKVQ